MTELYFKYLLNTCFKFKSLRAANVKYNAILNKLLQRFEYKAFIPIIFIKNLLKPKR